MAANTIGLVAQRSGVGVETVRFYQRRGLIQEPPTPAKGFRVYPEETIKRIRFIRRAKDLGFTLEEISGLLELKVEPAQNCASVKAYALDKIALIEEKIRSLDGIRQQLTRLTEACDDGMPTSECAILEALQ